MKTKEEILKEFDEFIGEAPEMVKMSEIVGKNICFVCGQPFNKSTQVEELRNLFIKAIAQTREETIREVEERLPKAQKINKKDWLGLNYTLGDVKYREHQYRLLVLDILNLYVVNLLINQRK